MKVAELIARAPDGIAFSDDLFIGLTEAIAWAATNDGRLSAAVAFHLSQKPEHRGASEDGVWRTVSDDGSYRLSIWLALLADCENVFHVDLEAAQSRFFETCAAGLLRGKGKWGASGFDNVPENDWIDARLSHRLADGIQLSSGVGSLLGDAWTQVRFLRADVLKIWPPLEQGISAPSPRPMKLGKVDAEEFRLWIVAQIEQGKNQTEILNASGAAFPDYILPGREDRRAIHRAEHRRLTGVDPKPGKDAA